MTLRPFRFLAAMLAVAAAAAPLRAQGPITIKVEIEGVTTGLFDMVEGLGSASDSSSHLVLKRVYDPSLKGLWNWRRSVIEGNPQKRDGRILFFDADGNLSASWVFRHGWPSRWEVPRVQAYVQDPGEEIVEIAHDGLTLEM